MLRVLRGRGANSLSLSEDPALFEPGEDMMMDLIFILLVVAFFSVSVFYIHFCERI